MGKKEVRLVEREILVADNSTVLNLDDASSFVLSFMVADSVWTNTGQYNID